MCKVQKGNALQCVDGEIAFARSALELSDTIQKNYAARRIFFYACSG